MEANMQAMEELVELEPSDAADKAIFSRIVKLANKRLPEGWKQWKVFSFNRESLLGKDYDPHVLNKIRFALPTVEMVQAFNPEATHVSEKGYREMKLSMLKWPFCIGLIISPSSLASCVRGSTAQNELVVAAVSNLKHLMDGDNLSLNTRGSRSKDRSQSRVSEVSDRGRIDKLEKSTEELKHMFQSFMEAFNNHSERATPDTEIDRLDASSIHDQSDGSEEVYNSKDLPPLLDLELEEEVEDDLPVDFAPQTREQEPSIPPAKPHIKSQGIDCLRLGKTFFNRVRYADVQKKLQASPVFCALNNQLLPRVSNNASFDQLSKTDLTLGTILHGLLMQRDSFAEAMKKLVGKHPSIKRDVQELLVGPESQFRQNSDDVLQYVSGRRSEVIDQRRKFFFQKNSQMNFLLEDMASKRNREPLSFKLVGMTEEDLYNEIDNLDKSDSEYVNLPSDKGSDNDSDFEDPDQELDILPPSDEIVITAGPKPHAKLNGPQRKGSACKGLNYEGKIHKVWTSIIRISPVQGQRFLLRFTHRARGRIWQQGSGGNEADKMIFVFLTLPLLLQAPFKGKGADRWKPCKVELQKEGINNEYFDLLGETDKIRP
ncbi:unnamed protein product [Brassicogethes aeneus]|uniref:Uncharacterized protein n=1 Tax=Brassicogethes aeneus TaxID=1431903 RepID=A0A9P0BGA3_BRAAE|nr:unnamed protein product [Brassicogethes aeneus]